MTKVGDFFRRLRSMSPEEIEEGGRRGAANIDAMAANSAGGKSDAAGGANLGSNVPPNYIKTYDEGRPRH
jgi:hypothetical protein